MGLTLAGFVALWLLLDRSAAALGSVRGEWGGAIALAIVALALTIEMIGRPGGVRDAARRLGFVAPTMRATIAALVLCAAMLASLPLMAWASGAQVALLPMWPWLALGMFMQGGIAEETVFRGFLFRRVREGQSTFWRAALISALPFVAVHLLLFASLEFAVALAAVAVAVATSFPLAWLYERAGNSVWPPALVHGVIQAGIKVIDAGEGFAVLAMAWMGVCALAPWALFLVLRR